MDAIITSIDVKGNAMVRKGGVTKEGPNKLIYSLRTSQFPFFPASLPYTRRVPGDKGRR